MLRNCFYGNGGSLFFFTPMIAISGMCAWLSVTQGFAQVRNVSQNVTTVEKLKGTWVGRTNRYRKSCVRNWEEVYGPRVFCPFWCCPFPIPKVEDGFGYEKIGEDDEKPPFIGGRR